MAKSSLQYVSNDVIFVHTNTHIRTVTKHKDKCSKRLPPSGFETLLGGMWRKRPPERDRYSDNRLVVPVLIGC